MMKLSLNIVLCVFSVGFSGCDIPEPTSTAARTPVPPQKSPAPAQATLSGTITETMNSGGYTYVSIKDIDGTSSWAAGPQTEVSVGDTVELDGGSPMPGFHSKTLNRTFEKILFVNAIRKHTKDTAQAAAQTADPHQPKASEPIVPVAPIHVARAKGGHRVNELFIKKTELANKPVIVRAQVVKFNANIMGKNWLHLQDGTGSQEAGNSDLTITTQDTANVGDTVLVSGSLSTDVNFGAGYTYPLIIQDAKITKE